MVAESVSLLALLHPHYQNQLSSTALTSSPSASVGKKWGQPSSTHDIRASSTLLSRESSDSYTHTAARPNSFPPSTTIGVLQLTGIQNKSRPRLHARDELLHRYTPIYLTDSSDTPAWQTLEACLNSQHLLVVDNCHSVTGID